MFVNPSQFRGVWIGFGWDMDSPKVGLGSAARPLQAKRPGKRLDPFGFLFFWVNLLDFSGFRFSLECVGGARIILYDIMTHQIEHIEGSNGNRNQVNQQL